MIALHVLIWRSAMLLITSTECRAIAGKKLAEAGRDKRHPGASPMLPKAGSFSPVN